MLRPVVEEAAGLSPGDDAGEDRLRTLFISQSSPCLERYPGNQSPRGLEDNPAFQSLTSIDQIQARMFDTVVRSRFTDLTQTVADDPELSATFSQLQGCWAYLHQILIRYLQWSPSCTIRASTLVIYLYVSMQSQLRFHTDLEVYFPHLVC